MGDHSWLVLLDTGLGGQRGQPVEHEPDDARIFSTAPDDPDNGDTYVWAIGRWFQRIEGPDGGVGFSFLGDSERDEWPVELEGDAELTELDNDYAREVRQEFWDISPMDMYTEDLSTEPPFEEQETD